MTNEIGEKSQERLKYATEQLEKAGIEFYVKNKETGHLNCYSWSDDKPIQFWAGSGKIAGFEERGIHSLIRLITDRA